jgi:hypothetical protein
MRSRHSVHVVVLALLLSPAVFCATSRVSTAPPELGPGEASCMADSECEITTFGSECCACKTEPYAINRQALAKKTDICTVVECRCNPGDDCTCPKVGDPSRFRAVCASGTCARRRN